MLFRLLSPVNPVVFSHLTKPTYRLCKVCIAGSVSCFLYVYFRRFLHCGRVDLLSPDVCITFAMFRFTFDNVMFSFFVFISSMTALIVGDSYVPRLAAYMARAGVDLQVDALTLEFIGVGGACVRGPSSSPKTLLALLTRAIRRADVRVMYINIGTNDLSRRSQDPTALAEDLMRLVRYALQSSATLHIFVGQIHHRLRVNPPWDVSLFNTRVDAANAALNRLVSTTERCQFVSIRGLRQPIPESYCDALHFSSAASYRVQCPELLFLSSWGGSFRSLYSLLWSVGLLQCPQLGLLYFYVFVVLNFITCILFRFHNVLLWHIFYRFIVRSLLYNKTPASSRPIFPT